MTTRKGRIAGVLLVTTILLWFALQATSKPEASTHSYAAFQQEILSGNVRSVTISPGSEATGKLNSGETFTVTLPGNDPRIFDLLDAHNVAIEIRSSGWPAWLSTLVMFLPILLGIASWVVIGFLLGVGFYWGIRWSRRFMTGPTTGGL